MIWKDIKTYRGGQDVKISIAVKNILHKLFINPDFEKMQYKFSLDHQKKRLIIDFKQKKD